MYWTPKLELAPRESDEGGYFLKRNGKVIAYLDEGTDGTIRIFSKDMHLKIEVVG